VQNEWSRKKFKKIILGVHLFKNTKRTFFIFFNILIYTKVSNDPILKKKIDSELTQSQFFEFF
jgi:hypothetical protein